MALFSGRDDAAGKRYLDTHGVRRVSSRRDKPWVVCRRLWKRQLAKGNCDAHSSEAAMDTAGRMVVAGCGIVVDAAVNDEKTSHELNAFTCCRLKAV
jgi:Mycobacterium membrane protein